MRPSDELLVRVPAGELMAPCWCERHYLPVSERMVATGRTWCCGHPECQQLVAA